MGSSSFLFLQISSHTKLTSRNTIQNWKVYIWPGMMGDDGVPNFRKKSRNWLPQCSLLRQKQLLLICTSLVFEPGTFRRAESKLTAYQSSYFAGIQTSCCKFGDLKNTVMTTEGSVATYLAIITSWHLVIVSNTCEIIIILTSWNIFL